MNSLAPATKTTRLDELGFVSRGRSRHRPRNDASLYGGEYPFFQTGDIKAANLYLTEYTQTYSEAGLAQSKMWDKGTLCITIAANIAETAILGIPGCFPDSVVGFIPDPDKADVRFIKYYIDILKLGMQSISRGTTQDNMSVEKLMSFDFDVPDLPTQRKIAGILSAYDDLIENNLRRIKILEEMAQSLYREWFIHFRFPGHKSVKFVDSELGQIPKGWEVKKLETLYRTSSGGTPSRKNLEYYEEGTIDWVKTGELKDGFVLSSEEKITTQALSKSSAKLFPANTVLIALYGATIGQLGILSREVATNQACCAILEVGQPFGRAFAYLTLLLRRNDIIGLRMGAAQQNISQAVLRDFEVICPSATSLEAFNQRAEPMFDLLLNLQRRNQTLCSTRDLLLPKLMKG
jgi:type I restriction enzyme S subunit